MIRCFMHVLNRAHIEKTVEDAIPAEREFLSGAIPEKVWRAKEPLTVVFTTKKGEVGLMNIYAGVTHSTSSLCSVAQGRLHSTTEGTSATQFAI